MSLLKTCAAILSLILLLQTGCDLLCSQASVVALASDCHGTPVESGSESKPASNRSFLDCDHLMMIAEDNSGRQTMVKATPQVGSRDFLSAQVRTQLHPLPFGALDKKFSDGSPLSSGILRI